MSRRQVILTAVLTLLLLAGAAAAGAVWLFRPSKTTLTLDVTGPDGLPIKGTAEVDGTSRPLEGSVPARFVLEGYRVTYSVESPAESGEIRVKASIGANAIGSLSMGEHRPERGVRGWVKSASWAGSPPTYWMEFKDEKGWAKPPPS
jgi:hypothetical protein